MSEYLIISNAEAIVLEYQYDLLAREIDSLAIGSAERNLAIHERAVTSKLLCLLYESLEELEKHS
jgi:hypothetical protein